MRKFGLLAATLLALCGGGCGSEPGPGPGPGDDSSLREVTFNMAWLPQGSMSGVLVAIDRGFYRDAGLDVSAVRGFGGIRTVNEIDQGMFDFGYGDPLAVILNRSQGGKAKIVGAINQRWPAALCYVKGRHAIETPADLRGLTVGGGRSSPMQVLLPMWLGANGIAAGDVTMMQLDPAVVIASLLEGQIDAGECWRANSIPLFEKRAKEADVEIGWIEYGAFGLDIYGNGLVTSEVLIAEAPDVVRKFVNATYEGYAFVLEQPEEATRIVLEQFPVLDPEVTRQQVDELTSLMSGTETLGWLEEDKVARTLSLVSEAYELEASLSPSELYTTEFLGGN